VPEIINEINERTVEDVISGNEAIYKQIDDQKSQFQEPSLIKQMIQSADMSLLSPHKSN